MKLCVFSTSIANKYRRIGKGYWESAVQEAGEKSEEIEEQSIQEAEIGQ